MSEFNADIENFRALQDGRYTWNVLYQKIADFMIPEKADFTVHRYPGQRRNYNIFDTTAIWAGGMLAAALHTMLTSPGAPWFYLSSGDPEIDGEQDVAEWLQVVGESMNSVFNDPVANFQSQIHELYLDLVYFGTASMYVGYHDRFTFRTHFLGECYFSEDPYGMIDTIYRIFNLTKRQIIQRFGDQDYGKDFAKAKEGASFQLLHAVVPDKAKWASRYWLLNEKKLIQEGSYAHFPYVVPRWEKSSAEIMGRGPGMKALGAVLGANEIKKTTIRAGHLATRPPLQAPDKGYITPISIAPESISYYDSTSPGRIEPIITGVRPEAGDAQLAATQKEITRMFYTEMLMLPGQEMPGGQNAYMSATEATIRRDNQLRLIGPILSRLQHELLGPLIHRVYALMLSHKMIPEAPDAIKGSPLKVEYRSPLAIAQRAAEGENLMRAVSIISPIAQINPGVMDVFNSEEIVRWAASITHTPQKLLLTKEQMAELRQQQAQAQQQQVQENKDALNAKRNMEAGKMIGSMMKAAT